MRSLSILLSTAIFSVLVFVTYGAVITSVSPTQGSTLGWTRVTILGTGFDIRGRSNLVFMGTGIAGVYCDPIPNECTTTRIICFTPPYDPVGVMPLTVNSFGYNAICSASSCTFEYTILKTPQVTMISPQWAIAPANITVYGRQFSQGDTTVAAFDFYMWIGAEERCNLVSSVTGSSFICNVISMRPGQLPVNLILSASGKASLDPSASTVTIVPSISAVSPAQGSTAGGQLVTIMGSSFSPDVTDNYVTIHGAPCIVTSANNAQLICVTTPHVATTTATRSYNANNSYRLDVYLNLVYGYDLDLYFVGTQKYLSPDVTKVLFDDMSIISNWGCESCGFRVTSHFIPTFTGWHNFSVYGDDYYEMWLGDSEEPVERKRQAPDSGSRPVDIDVFNSFRIISRQGCCSWIDAPPRYLVKGKPYWLRMFVKNVGGGLALNGRVSFDNITNAPLTNFLYYSPDWNSPVKVVVADTPALPQASCYNYSSCNFNFAAAATAAVTSVSPAVIVPLSTITITGTGFDVTATPPAGPSCNFSMSCGDGGCNCLDADSCNLQAPLCSWSSGECYFTTTAPPCFQWSLNKVTIGGAPCNITSQSATSLECAAPFVPAGYHKVVVEVGSNGLASSNSYVQLQTTIARFFPTNGSINGGNALTIVGHGFSTAPGVTTVTVGSKPCPVQSVTYGTIICTVPPQSAAGTLSVSVSTTNDQVYVLPNSYQYDAKPVRPGTTIESNDITMTPLSGSAFGGTPMYISLPTTVSLSSAQSIAIVVGGIPCTLTFAGGSNAQCTTQSPVRVGTFSSSISFVDKFGGQQVIALPDFTYFHTVRSISPATQSPFGNRFDFALSEAFSINEVNVSVGGVPCSMLSLRGTTGTCFGPPMPTSGATTPKASFDFLGDGNALTNPLNPYVYSSGVSVGTDGNANVPAGEYVFTRKRFSRPFAVRATLKPSRAAVKFSTVDVGVTLKACVTQPTLSSDGYRATAGASNASFTLFGGNNQATGYNMIQDAYTMAFLDTTRFQEHRLEVWNQYIKYYVNNILIYTMYDTAYSAGMVGIGFSNQAVVLQKLTVDSLYPQSFQVNVSGVPISSPIDILYSTNYIPSAKMSVDTTKNVITLIGPVNVDVNTVLYGLASETATVTASSPVLCTGFFTTVNAFTGATVYSCQALLGPGNYYALLYTYYGAAAQSYGVTLGFRVTSVLPSSLPLSGGRVTVFGIGFSGAATVTTASTALRVITYNASMIVVDIPPSASATSVSLTVSDGINTQTTSVTVTAASPVNITGANVAWISQWSSVTLTAGGFSTGVKAFLNDYPINVDSVTATTVGVTNTVGSAKVAAGNVTIKLVQSGGGTATWTIPFVPYVNGAASPSVVASSGGATVFVPGVSLGNLMSATPVTTLASDFTTGMPPGWTASSSGEAPRIHNSCRTVAFGPFAGSTQVQKLFTGLPAHQYVRVFATIATTTSSDIATLVVDGNGIQTNVDVCQSEAACPSTSAANCVSEAFIILRHNGSSLPVSLYSHYDYGYFMMSVTVELYSSLPYVVSIGSAIVPVDVVNYKGLSFTTPSGMAVASSQAFSLKIDDVERCRASVCKFAVINPPTLTSATIAVLRGANVTAPHFASTVSGTNVTYDGDSTTIVGSPSSGQTVYSTQKIYRSDSKVIRVSTIVPSRSTFQLFLTNAAMNIRLGLYSDGGNYLYALGAGGWYYSQYYTPSNTRISFEFDTTTNTVAFLIDDQRFAAVHMTVAWPLVLSLYLPSPLKNIKVESALPEDRVVFFGTDIYPSSSSALSATVNGTNCRSVYATNGRLSCYLPRGVIKAGMTASVEVTTAQGVAASTQTVQVQPHILTISTLQSGANGGVVASIAGGPFAAGDLSLNICDTIVKSASPKMYDIDCVVKALGNGVTVNVTGNSSSAALLVVNDTSLSGPTASFLPLSFTTTVAPAITAVDNTADKAYLTLTGTNIPSDSVVNVFSASAPLARCLANASNVSATSITCLLTSAKSGTFTVWLTSPSVGVSNNATVSLTTSISAASPAITGTGGLTKLIVTGYQFNGGANVSLSVNNTDICTTIRADNFNIECTTKRSVTYNGTLAITVDGVKTTSAVAVQTSGAVAMPTVTSVSPAAGPGGSKVTITGTNFASSDAYIGGKLCVADAGNTATQIVCTVSSEVVAGRLQVVVIHSTYGASADDVAFRSILLPLSVFPGQGPRNGGQAVTIQGRGFSADASQTISLGGALCSASIATPSSVVCSSSALVDTYNFDIAIKVADSSVVSTTASSTYAFTSDLTATVTSVFPTSRSASGMELITIVGSGFGTDVASVTVTIGSASCRTESVNNTQIVCRTTPTAPLLNQTVNVLIGNKGYATSTTRIDLPLQISSIAAVSDFSVEGGAVLTIVGTGFWTFNRGDWQASYYTVTIAGYLDCPILTSNWSVITCTLPPSPRPRTYTPTLSPSYILPPSANLTVDVSGNGVAAAVNYTSVRVRYSQGATPTIGNVLYTPAIASSNTVTAGTVVTIGGTGFAATGNKAFIGASPCAITAERSDQISCTINATTGFGPHFVSVLVPSVGFATTPQTCASGFLSCDGKCLTDTDCRYDAWGATSCSDLNTLVPGDTFCNANGGSDSLSKPFLTDNGASFNLNCPMYSCEGNDCNTTLSIGGYGGVVSSCGRDPNGYLIDFRPKVTAVSGGVASSLGGGLRLTIAGLGLPLLNDATVLVDSTLCAVISATSTEIVCDTGAAAVNGTALTLSVYGGGYLAVCPTDVCRQLFSYVTSITPVVTSASYSAAAQPSVTIAGSNFGVDSSKISVFIGATGCTVSSANTTAVICTPSFNLSAGLQSLQVLISGVGLSTGVAQVTIPLTIQSFSPTFGSKQGGTLVTILGTGFTSATSITIGSSCIGSVVSTALDLGKIVARTAACGSSGKLKVRTDTLTFSSSADFVHNATVTPTVTGTVGASNDFTLSFAGASVAGFDVTAFKIYVDSANCNVATPLALPSLSCTMDATHAAGAFNITVEVLPYGYAVVAANLVATYGLTVTGINATSGNRGGNQVLRVSGTGFGTNSSEASVTIGSSVCTVLSCGNTYIDCLTGPSSSSGAANVVVSIKPSNAKALQSDATFNSFTYSAVSPTVTSVSPSRGSTAGGTKLTIVGTDLASTFTVSVMGVVCTQSAAEQQATTNAAGTRLFCTTGAYLPMFAPAAVRVTPSGSVGDAFNTGNITYQYIDLWSRWTTWGNSPPPQFGDSAVISEGQVVMIDYSPPRFHLIIVMGTLLFDDTVDITLECTYVMINYGRFIVGTPSKPYTKQATIRLWGNRLTPEIPVHGAKVIALRYGSIDMHGIPRSPTWTRLAATAPRGVSTIFIQGPVDWVAGEFIVIAPTDYDPLEGEKRMIVDVINGNTTNVTIQLEYPLAYTHFGVRQCFGTGADKVCVDEVAEVGLLTRNIVVEGEPNSMNIGFGGTMFLMPMGATNDMYCRLSFIELRRVGQQYIVGRYPVHYHVTGTVSNSYVNGTAVHDSLNRAYSIHGTSNNTYVDNVVYNVQGHAFFIEDGSERYNLIRHNLVIQDLATTSNLNTDITPACIWITAPMNFIENNAVSGSQAFGIWYMPFDPYSTGPTFSTSVCPFRQAIGSNVNNVAHSNLWHGFHVFKFWIPKVAECNANSADAPAVIRNLVVYKNNIWGATLGNMEIGRIGAITFENLTSADNGFTNQDGANYWIEHMIAPNMSVGVKNSVLIALTNNNPYRREKRRRGVNLPQDDNFFVENITFVNYDGENFAFEPQAWAHFKSLCFPYGWESVVRGLKFINSPNRVLFRFQHHGIINDDDGSLSGVAGSQVVPASPINQAPVCNDFGSGAPVYSAIVCPNTYKIRRFGVSTSTAPQLDQIWQCEGRVEINPVIDRSYVFTAPINKEINITFQTIATPNWGWRFGGVNFMQPTERALFTTTYMQAPYSVITAFDGSVKNSTYWGNAPTLDQNTSSYAYNNITTKLSILLARPNVAMFATSAMCPPQGCSAPSSIINVSDSCTGLGNASAWNRTAGPDSSFDAVISNTSHFCFSANTNSSNCTVTFTFSSIELRGALTMTNEQCPCKGGRVILNIYKYFTIKGGVLQIGNATNPIRDCFVEINFIEPPWTSDTLASYKDGLFGYRSFSVQSGNVKLFGKRPTPVFSRLSATAAAGSTTLTLESAVQWAVGDVVAIAGTTRAKKYTLARLRSDESEHIAITAISADNKTITLAKPLQFTHYGATQQSLNGRTFFIGAEVAVLSRNIIIGAGAAADYFPLYHAGWQLNVGCTPLNKDGCTEKIKMTSANPGFFQVEGTLFRDAGQSSLNPVITLDGLTDGVDASQSFIRYNSFWRGFNTPINVRETTVGIEISNNFIYDIWDDGIRVGSAGNNITGNLVMKMNNSDANCNPAAYNIAWDCRTAMFRIHAGNLVANNIAASGIGAGFVTEGEFCTSPDQWSNNVAHSMRDGMLIADNPALPEWNWGTFASPTSCRRISGVTTYWSADHGIVAWYVTGNVTISNYVSVDDQVGTFVMTFQVGQFQDYIPFVNYTDIIYASKWNAEFTCRQGFVTNPLTPCRGTTLNSAFWCSFFGSTVNTTSTQIGNVGAMETIFTSNALGAGITMGEHKMMFEEMDSYSTVGGQARYKNVHFANYEGLTDCGHRNVAFFQSMYSNDTFHQHTFENISWASIAPTGKLFTWRTYGKVEAWPTDIRTDTYFLDFNNYIHGAFWPDSPNKQLLIDLDGSFTETKALTSVVASETITRTSKFSEIGWTGQAFTGSKLSAARDGCTWNANMNAFVCDSRFKWVSLNLDSLADDQLTRRAGPVVLCKGDGMIQINGDPICQDGVVDFASGPVMKGKAARSTQDRLSRWRFWAEDGGNYTLSFRGMPPQWLRMELKDYEYLNKGTNVGITINLRYNGANSACRVGVYVNGKRLPSSVGPRNPWEMVPAEHWPNATDPAGTHYMNLYTDGSIQLSDGSFGLKKNILYVTVRPGARVDLIQEPVVQVNMAVSMTVDEFFQKKDTFAAALASVLGISASRIKFANIVAGTTRRRVGSLNITVQIEPDMSNATIPTSSTPASGGSPSSGTTSGGSASVPVANFGNLVQQLQVLATNTSAIAAAAGDTSFVVSGMSFSTVAVQNSRPPDNIPAGTPYVGLNVSTNSFASSDVITSVQTWIVAKFPNTAPFNNTLDTVAVSNPWTNTTSNVSQFVLMFVYTEPADNFAAVDALNAQLLSNPSAALPTGYTLLNVIFNSNGYVAPNVTNGTTAPTAAPTATPALPTGVFALATADNITKFAIGVGIGVAIVLVVGGAILFHLLVVRPKQLLRKREEEKIQLQKIIEEKKSAPQPQEGEMV